MSLTCTNRCIYIYHSVCIYETRDNAVHIALHLVEDNNVHWTWYIYRSQMVTISSFAPWVTKFQQTFPLLSCWEELGNTFLRRVVEDTEKKNEQNKFKICIFLTISTEKTSSNKLASATYINFTNGSQHQKKKNQGNGEKLATDKESSHKTHFPQQRKWNLYLHNPHDSPNELADSVMYRVQMYTSVTNWMFELMCENCPVVWPSVWSGVRQANV